MSRAEKRWEQTRRQGQCTGQGLGGKESKSVENKEIILFKNMKKICLGTKSRYSFPFCKCPSVFLQHCGLQPQLVKCWQSPAVPGWHDFCSEIQATKRSGHKVIAQSKSKNVKRDCGFKDFKVHMLKQWPGWKASNCRAFEAC